MRVLPTLLAAGAGLLAAAPAAQAATIEPLGACYRSVKPDTRETVPVRAFGYTPGEHVNVFVDGALVQQDVVVGAEGQIVGSVPAPYQPSGERTFTVTITEVEKPSNTASATSLVTALSLRLKPRRAAPQERVRFIGSGFIDGDTVYAHYVRKDKLRKTVSLGAPEGPCGRISVKRRQIPVRRAALGRWTLQVDNQQAYSPRPDGVAARISIRVTKAPRQVASP